MDNLRLTVIAALLALAASVVAMTRPAHAITALAFDHGRVVAPQQFEAGGGITFGSSDAFYGFAMGRLGLLPDFEAQLRFGAVSFNEQTGFELEGGTKFRFLRMEDTGGAVDLAFTAMGSLLKTGDVFVFGADPSLVASHHFDLASDRQIFVSAHIGLAMTFSDVDGSESDTDFDLIGGVAAGVDIVARVRLSLEGRLRAEDKRAGVLVTYLF